MNQFNANHESLNCPAATKALKLQQMILSKFEQLFNQIPLRPSIAVPDSLLSNMSGEIDVSAVQL